MRRAAVLLTAVLCFLVNDSPSSVGCTFNSCSELKWGYAPGAFDSYEVNSVSVTPSGIAYDDSGLPIDPALIDRLTDEVEQCLSSLQMLDCGRVVLPIDRKSFVVKVASDWVISCDKTQQLLPVLSGDAGCLAKGEQPSDQCPCRWRAGISCPNVLVVTPSFFLYKDVLIRFTTGCRNPWASEALSLCASPSTAPL